MATRASSNLVCRLTIRKPTVTVLARTYSTAPVYKRPPYPSVEVLLHKHNLEAAEIKATGPQGRLLKGDVLAHIGSISKETPDKLSQRFEKLSHLDLSNIKAAAPKEEKAATPAKAAQGLVEEAEDVEQLSLAIDLKPLLKLQKRLQDVLGHTPDLSELIARAVDLANRDLPASSRPPTTDELFDDIIAGSVRRATLRLEDGDFVPAINASTPPLPPSFGQSVDIFDELIGTPPMRPKPSTEVKPGLPQGSINGFSVTTSSYDRERATLFLQRMKSVMEIEPGRLVL